MAKLGRPPIPLETRFYKSVSPEPTSGCWLWTAAATPMGYGRIAVWDGDRLVNGQAHRVSWEMHRGPVPPGLHVLHRCDNPACCNPDHLFVGTNADNVADRVAKRRTVVPCGERNPRSRLTADQVVAIRRRRLAGETLAALARAYGVSPVAVRKVVLRKTWAHVGGDA